MAGCMFLFKQKTADEMRIVDWSSDVCSSDLTRNWGLFFIAMALLNEAVWRTQSTDFWIAFKLWGVVALSLVFAMAQAPILMKHGKIGRAQGRERVCQSV